MTTGTRARLIAGGLLLVGLGFAAGRGDQVVRTQRLEVLSGDGKVIVRIDADARGRGRITFFDKNGSRGSTINTDHPTTWYVGAAQWYSGKQNAALVYHNNARCHLGNNVEPENVRQGTGDRRLCSECDRLNKSEGK